VGVKAQEPALGAPTATVQFPPVWRHIQPLSAYVAALLDAKGRSDATERVTIVVHELIENAVKYGDPASEVKFELFADAGQAVVVRVSNKAHPSRVAILEREVRRNAATNPREAFARALERLQHLPEGSTMLGLARVSLEAELAVDTTTNGVVATAKIDTNSARTSAPFVKGGARDAIRAEPESAAGRPRERGPSVSQTRRVDMSFGRSSESNPAMNAVGKADSGGKPR